MFLREVSFNPFAVFVGTIPLFALVIPLPSTAMLAAPLPPPLVGPATLLLHESLPVHPILFELAYVVFVV